MPIRQSVNATFTTVDPQQTPYANETEQHHKRDAIGNFTKVKFALSRPTKNDHVWSNRVSHQFFE